MVIVNPTHRGQHAHGQEDDGETPIVKRAEAWVPPSAFGTQHGNGARDNTEEPSQDVDGQNAEKKWRVGWDWNPSHGYRSLIHVESGQHGLERGLTRCA